jgi:hypothetical protein
VTCGDILAPQALADQPYDVELGAGHRSDQQPATKADLYAAVDAMRADMRQLLDQISTLVREVTQGAESRDGHAARNRRPGGGVRGKGPFTGRNALTSQFARAFVRRGEVKW